MPSSHPPDDPQHGPTEVASDNVQGADAEEQGLTTGFIPTFRPARPEEKGAPKKGDDHPFQAGQRLGDFQILGVLGRGAFATVYLARQPNSGSLLTAKVAHF